MSDSRGLEGDKGEDDAARRYVLFNGKKFGDESLANAAAVFPFVLHVTVDHNSYPSLAWSNSGLVRRQKIEQFYCVWFCGAVVRVPFTTKFGQPTSLNLTYGRRQPTRVVSPTAGASSTRSNSTSAIGS